MTSFKCPPGARLQAVIQELKVSKTRSHFFAISAANLDPSAVFQLCNLCLPIHVDLTFETTSQKVVNGVRPHDLGGQFMSTLHEIYRAENLDRNNEKLFGVV